MFFLSRTVQGGAFHQFLGTSTPVLYRRTAGDAHLNWLIAHPLRLYVRSRSAFVLTVSVLAIPLHCCVVLLSVAFTRIKEKIEANY